MLRYTASFLAERTSHPILIGLFILGGLFLVSGVVVEPVTGNKTAAGFFGVYATIATTLGIAGYVILFGARIVRQIRRSYGPA